MGIKFDADLNIDGDELARSIQSAVDNATHVVAQNLYAEGHKLSSSKMESSEDLWKKGYAIDKVEDGSWIISLTGKLANMVEEGIKPGEISDMLLNGPRARLNAQQSPTNTKHVDVPLEVNPAKRTSANVPKLDVQKFRDADAVRKYFNFSDGKGGVKRQQRIVRRVDQIIESRKKTTSKPTYLTIRAVSENGPQWPQGQVPGKHIFKSLENMIEKEFEKVLEQLL